MIAIWTRRTNRAAGPMTIVPRPSRFRRRVVATTCVGDERRASQREHEHGANGERLRLDRSHGTPPFSFMSMRPGQRRAGDCSAQMADFRC